MNLRETIKETTRKHLESGEKLLGQCITAVGWVNGTVPEHKNIIELPCTDVSAPHIASGMALAGAKPILVIRFQDFLMLNSDGIVNFAAKQKDIWHKTCPIFVRALSQEGKGTGPTHSAKLHSVFMHFPGLRVHSPVSPKEWLDCYNEFMANDDPMLCSEYKSTFDNEAEMVDDVFDGSQITLIGIGTARLPMVLSSYELYDIHKIKCDTFHIAKLKPFVFNDDIIKSIEYTKRCLVVDCGFDICGAGSWIAQKLSEKTGIVCHSIGLEDRSVSVAKERENSTPDTYAIVKKSLEIIRRVNG